MSELLTTGQAADALGVSVPTVIAYYEKGVLSGITLPSGHRRISRESLEQFKNGEES